MDLRFRSREVTHFLPSCGWNRTGWKELLGPQKAAGRENSNQTSLPWGAEGRGLQWRKGRRLLQSRWLGPGDLRSISMDEEQALGVEKGQSCVRSRLWERSSAAAPPSSPVGD